jgi:NAD(P) transhydrogenase beta subunit
VRSHEQVSPQRHPRRIRNGVWRACEGGLNSRNSNNCTAISNRYLIDSIRFPLLLQVIEGRVHTEIDAAGAAEMLRNAEKIVIVPGYGLAVAQAAGVVSEIALKLRKDGKDVKFAVHPVVRYPCTF